MKPLVTIQCIVYNHSAFLKQTLDGFVMQKTTFPFEAIVHDDKSTDDSADIIKAYAETYPDIIIPIFETENQYSKHDGSLERIMENATKGRYVAVCEGDDYWTDPYKLQKQYDFMEKNPDYVMCYHNAFSDAGIYRGLEINPSERSHQMTHKELLSGWTIPTPTVFYRQEAYKQVEHSKAYVNDDYALELRLASQGKVYYDDSIMSAYRRHHVGISAQLNSDKADMFQKLIDLLQDLRVLFPNTDQPLFDEAIKRYQKQKDKIIREQLHPWLRYSHKNYYKKLIKRLLHL